MTSTFTASIHLQRVYFFASNSLKIMFLTQASSAWQMDQTETGNNVYHHCVLCEPISRLDPRSDLDNYLIMLYKVN